MTQLKICSWNIAGLKDKLQDENILRFIMEFDVIFIQESKRYFHLNVPGFNVYTNVSTAGQHRGGMVMLLKCYLSDEVLNVNTDDESQIWLTMSWWPSFKFGGIYIPPDDSPYYSPVLHGKLAAHTLPPDNVIVLGDFNGRVGTPLVRNEEGQIYQYSGGLDAVTNNNGRALMNICNNNDMVIVNNLLLGDKHFKGNLTYRQGRRWVSEIDLCLSKKSCLSSIYDLQVHQTVNGSDHAPISISLRIKSSNTVAIRDLVSRSIAINKPGDGQPVPLNNKLKKSLNHKEIDTSLFTTLLQEIPPPIVESGNDLEVTLASGFNLIVDVAGRCKKEPTPTGPEWDRDQPRWARILHSNDSKLIWQSINWKGDIASEEGSQPNDEMFKNHFENLLDPEMADNMNFSCSDFYSNVPYIPLLDDPFTMTELEVAVNGMNKNKSYHGICPGILSWLPANWMLFMLTLLNVVFVNICYPISWCVSKLVLLFKSGCRMSCGNYRGISIMDTLAKIYDILILKRLTLWCNIDKCQAGAQKGRSCIEQILTLRLLCDYAVFKKVKLYVLFVDFSKAYDRVPRYKMLNVLKENGCGKRMLMAIKGMYTCTKHILKSAVINASIGVRQGAPTSCILFIIYIDRLVRMLRETVTSDGFLGSLNILLLMDDAVILATSREMCEKKLKLLCKYCNDYGMIINESKTKFFVINNNIEDKEALNVENVTVSYTDRYLYLGAWFSDSGKMGDIIDIHVARGEAVVNKFAIFCTANSGMPYVYKKRVFDAAVLSSLLYSCESWLTNNIKGVEKQYNKLIRCLLGVRKNTSPSLCMLEAGIVPITDIVRKNQKSFLISKRENVDEELPFNYVFNMCRDSSTPGFRFLSGILEGNSELNSLQRIAREIREKSENATKLNTYVTELNPSLGVHEVYSAIQYIPDYYRVSFTRLRLMSHNLRVETGRWSRTPAYARTCPCDKVSIQTESHVLISCPLSNHCRQRWDTLDYTNVNNLMKVESNRCIDLCKYIDDVLNVYK